MKDESDCSLEREDVLKILRRVSTEMIMDFLQQPCKEYDSWLEKLPEEPVKGLNDASIHYMKSWGSGGGDYSTEVCATNALKEEPSDCAPVVAKTIYGSIAGYSKTPFEASVFVMDLLRECLEECGK